MSTPRLVPFGVSFAAAFSLAGCVVPTGTHGPDAGPPQTSNDAGPADSGPAVMTSYTWYRDVQPIVNTNCAGCHVTGGIGPFDLTTYANFSANSLLAEADITSKKMPPWMPSNDTPAMVNQRGLSDAQIALVQNWIAGGMPEGDPSMEPNEPPPANPFVADATIEPPAAYTPNASLGTDDYHCFALDPQLTADTAVTAFNILPGDRRVVHHVILYAVAPSDASALAALEDANGGYTCFGGPGLNNPSIIGGWVPGTLATTFPAGTGVVLKAGTKIVMQVHYNLLVVQHTTDQTTAQLEYATSTSAVTAAYIVPLVNNTFSIAPGEVKTVTANFDTSSLNLPAGVQLKLWGMLPHMHLHGTDINVVGTDATGNDFLLIDIPKWQFQWQQMYFFQSPFLLGTGESATLSCTFDNTTANQPVINGVQETPTTLTWGEDTLQEMCLNFFYATVAL